MPWRITFLTITLKFFPRAFGVLKQVDPRFLADAENLFIIVQFKADTKHLNRYKALRFEELPVLTLSFVFYC